jgi:hypothetical protein
MTFWMSHGVKLTTAFASRENSAAPPRRAARPALPAPAPAAHPTGPAFLIRTCALDYSGNIRALGKLMGTIVH